MLTGTEKGMQETFGRSDCTMALLVLVSALNCDSRHCSTCHGAGRARSRNNSRNKLEYQASGSVAASNESLLTRREWCSQEVLDSLKTKGVAIRVASPKLVMEEAPESYKDVTQARCAPCLLSAAFAERALCRLSIRATLPESPRRL